MGLLDRLVLKRIDTEIAWLKELRTSAETWYNELTEPLLPVLSGRENASKKYVSIAKKLYEEELRINAGNAVKNTFEEMGDRGITIKSRTKLAPLIEGYLKAGSFVKAIGFRSEPNPKEAIEKWTKFKENRELLISEINIQLKKII